MEPSAENVSAPLNRIRLYREFLGKEHECVQISRFLAALCESYGLSAKAPLRVLDAGCGVGRMFDEMVITHKWETTGIEPDRDYFEESCKVADEIRSRNPEAQLRVIHAGFTGMNEHNRYDLVAAINGPFYYLLHPQDRLHALQSIYSSLAPGGIILLDMANFQYLLHQLGPVGERTATKSIDNVPIVRVMNISLDWHRSVWTHQDDFYTAVVAPDSLICQEKHSFCITSPPDIAFLCELAGFQDIRYYRGWDSDPAAETAETLTGMRIMISARKPRSSTADN